MKCKQTDSDSESAIFNKQPYTSYYQHGLIEFLKKRKKQGPKRESFKIRRQPSLLFGQLVQHKKLKKEKERASVFVFDCLSIYAKIR